MPGSALLGAGDRLIDGSVEWLVTDAGPVRARFARWSKAMIDVLDRPRLGPLVMLASSGIGFPPLAVVTVAAGIKRVNMVLFCAVTTIGCLARFLVTAWLVSRGISLGH